jgi:hypothetical protein
MMRFVLASCPALGRLALGLAFLTVTCVTVVAAPPTTVEERAKIVGQPVSVRVEPASILLTGPRGMRQLVVTGHYADGTVRDLTPFVDIQPESAAVLNVSAEHMVIPLQNGTTNLLVNAGPLRAQVPVTVRDFNEQRPISFRNDLIAALNVGGCNSGACHGTPTGKNGFKLSLRGYDPAADYIQLTRDVLGRRTDRVGPDSALILNKALGRVPHEGGPRFPASSVPARVLRSWLMEGLADDAPSLAPLQKVEVVPGNRVQSDPDRWQQLAVVATFADGQTRDVTRLTVFSSSDNAIASVSTSGLVEFAQTGEVAILCRYLQELVSVRLTYLETKPGFKWSSPPENNYVDKHIFAKLKLLNILPSDLCTDQEFIRRAYIDVCGILPTAEETKRFLDSSDTHKRAQLIDELLERPEYADQWTLKWSDVFRSSRKSIQLKGTHVFQTWLRGHIASNDGFDQIVREVLTAGGSTFSNPAANYYRIARDPTSVAETTAQLFFGIRMQCAKCHNHPFERWTQDDYYSMSAWFARVKQRKDPTEPGATPQAKDGAEFIYVDRSSEVTQPRTGKTMAPKFMGGATPTLAPGKDRREVLAAWMTSADNPFVPKSLANRIWFHLTGKGIVDPVDDFRDSNPSANDDLLDALAKDFTGHHFDVKYLIRTIMNSRTYQLSAQTSEFNKDDSKYFSHAVTKLHTAEQLFDALCYTTMVPEKFAGFPLGTRATQLPDGEVNQPFLKTFGQPARELACECERESDSNLAQALQLINGPAVNDRLRNPNNRIGKLLAKKMDDHAILGELFLATLSRGPNDAEAKAMLDHVGRSVDKRKAWEDVHWALINSKEFLFRH